MTRALVGGPHYPKFPLNRYYAVPNVSHGWGLEYEADLIAVSKASHRAFEVEIKVSSADLRADMKKAKWRAGLDKRITKFWYAIPLSLVPIASDVVPAEFGILVFRKHRVQDFLICETFRKPAWLSKEKCTDADVINLLRLSNIRYWDGMK